MTTRLADVQAEIQQFIHADTILVGHSLENDLQALKILHTKVIDTSLLYPHPSGNGYKQALKYLTSKYLHRTIQADTHDSVQDGIAAMDLLKLKLKHGPDFGTDDADTESLFVRLEESKRKCTMIDQAYNINKYIGGTASGIPTVSDQEVIYMQ